VSSYSEGKCSPIDPCFTGASYAGAAPSVEESFISAGSTAFFLFFFASIFYLASLIAFSLAICLAFSFALY